MNTAFDHTMITSWGIRGGQCSEKVTLRPPEINYLRLVRTGLGGPKRFRFSLAIPTNRAEPIACVKTRSTKKHELNSGPRILGSYGHRQQEAIPSHYQTSNTELVRMVFRSINRRRPVLQVFGTSHDSLSR